MIGMLFPFTFCLCLAAGPSTETHPIAFQRQRQDVTIAFLEDWCDDPYGKKEYRRQVRRAFVYEHGAWSECPRLSTEAGHVADLGVHKWYALRPGKVIGKVESVPYPDIRSWQVIANTEQIIRSSLSQPPAVRDPASKFSGCSGESLSEPIILSTKRYCGRGDVWSDTEKKPEIGAALTILTSRQTRDSFGGEVTLLDSLSTADMKITHAFTDHAGDFLFGLEIQSSAKGHDDDFVNYYSFWFAQTPTGPIRFIGACLTPIAILDLNNDGSPEYVFWMALMRNHGYRIVFDGFSQSKTFDFAYG